jgi:hypothetical protein
MFLQYSEITPSYLGICRSCTDQNLSKNYTVKEKVNLSLVRNQVLFRKDIWGSGDITPRTLTSALEG